MPLVSRTSGRHPVGRRLASSVLAAAVVGAALTLAACDLPERVTNYTENQQMVNYEYDAMHWRYPKRSRKVLQEDWALMTREERSDLVEQHRSAERLTRMAEENAARTRQARLAQEAEDNAENAVTGAKKKLLPPEKQGGGNGGNSGGGAH